MCLSSPPTPAVPPLPPPAPPPPKPADPEVKRARTRNKQAAALTSGQNRTIATSAQGLQDSAAPTAKKTFLGL